MAVIEINLTADNLDDVRAGDVLLDGGEDLGRIRSLRLTRDGFENAKLYGELGEDVLGLPSTIRVERV